MIIEDKTNPDPSSEERARETQNRFFDWVNFLTKYALGSKLEANSLGFGPEERVAFVAALGAISQMIINNASDHDKDIYQRSIKNAIDALQPVWQSVIGKLEGDLQ